MRQTFQISEGEMLLLHDCDAALLIHCVDVMPLLTILQ
jgi:hypothetical protein